VAWHLRHVYRKLDVDSRPALIARLEETDGAAAAPADP
jgi:DNA-binding CsgD family transcriptional regulator